MFVLDTDHLGIIQRRTRPEFDRLWPRIAAGAPGTFYASYAFWLIPARKVRRSFGSARPWDMA